MANTTIPAAFILSLLQYIKSLPISILHNSVKEHNLDLTATVSFLQSHGVTFVNDCVDTTSNRVPKVGSPKETTLFSELETAMDIPEGSLSGKFLTDGKILYSIEVNGISLNYLYAPGPYNNLNELKSNLSSLIMEIKKAIATDL